VSHLLAPDSASHDRHVVDEHRSTIVLMAASALLDLNSLSNLTLSIGGGKSGLIQKKAALGA
jgi:hypothetical protein